MTRSNYTFQITVMGPDRWTAERQRAAIEERSLQSELIPLYLWSWQYLTPQVEEVAGGGSIGASTVSVRVAAVNAYGQESLASESAAVTVSANAAVKVLIPPWPRAAPVAKEYRVYAGALDAEKLEATIATVPTGGVPVVHTLTALAGTGASVPTSSMFFARFIRIDAIRGLTLEHPAIDGAFDAQITLECSVQLPRNPVAVWAEPISEVSVSTLEVSGG